MSFLFQTHAMQNNGSLSALQVQSCEAKFRATAKGPLLYPDALQP